MPNCPHCDRADSVVRKGFRYTKKYGRVQMWFCRLCDRKFSPGSEKRKRGVESQGDRAMTNAERGRKCRLRKKLSNS